MDMRRCADVAFRLRAGFANRSLQKPRARRLPTEPGVGNAIDEDQTVSQPEIAVETIRRLSNPTPLPDRPGRAETAKGLGRVISQPFC